LLVGGARLATRSFRLPRPRSFHSARMGTPGSYNYGFAAAHKERADRNPQAPTKIQANGKDLQADNLPYMRLSLLGGLILAPTLLIAWIVTMPLLVRRREIALALILL